MCRYQCIIIIQHPYFSRLFSGESPHHDDISIVLGVRCGVHDVSVWAAVIAPVESLCCNYIETPDTFIMSRIMRLMAATIQP